MTHVVQTLSLSLEMAFLWKQVHTISRIKLFRQINGSYSSQLNDSDESIELSRNERKRKENMLV